MVYNMKFICENCGYRFDSGYDRRDSSCPYCQEKTVVAESSAEDLVDSE